MFGVMTLNPDTVYFLIRYLTSGLAGAVIQITFDFVFVEVFERHYMEGVVTGFLFALVCVFILQKYWTFRDISRSHMKRQFFLYTVISLWSLGANVFCMYLFVSKLGFWYIWAQVVTVVLVAGTSLAFNTLLTFKRSVEATV